MRAIIILSLLASGTQSVWAEAVPKRIFGATYPRLAHVARIQGSVQLEASVSSAGTVSTIQVITGDVLLAPAAVESLKRWGFLPCSEPSCKFAVKFVFVLESGECTISECPNDLEFDLPATLIVRSKYAKPIIN
jgi:TonB family protein